MEPAPSAAAVADRLAWCRREICAIFAQCCDSKPKVLFAEAVAKLDAARALLDAPAKPAAVTGALEECGEAVSAIAGTCCHDLRPHRYQGVSDALSEAAFAARS